MRTDYNSNFPLLKVLYVLRKLITNVIVLSLFLRLRNLEKEKEIRHSISKPSPWTAVFWPLNAVQVEVPFNVLLLSFPVLRLLRIVFGTKPQFIVEINSFHTGTFIIWY